jgi:hypothetical protein
MGQIMADNFRDDYVDVAERIRIFRDKYPDGSLQPFNPGEPFKIVEVGALTFITYTAVAYRHPEDTLPGIAVAWEKIPGATPFTRDSELMNAETAAWGRAILAALAADSKRIASLDEVRARRAAHDAGHPSAQSDSQPQPTAPGSAPTAATEPQERALYALSKKLDKLPPSKGSLTKVEAGKLIEKLQAELDGQQ